MRGKGASVRSAMIAIAGRNLTNPMEPTSVSPAPSRDAKGIIFLVVVVAVILGLNVWACHKSNPLPSEMWFPSGGDDFYIPTLF